MKRPPESGTFLERRESEGSGAGSRSLAPASGVGERSGREARAARASGRVWRGFAGRGGEGAEGEKAAKVENAPRLPAFHTEIS